MAFVPAPEYHVFPTRQRPLRPYQAVVRAAGEMAPVLAAVRPAAVVSDILTLAPALAAEAEGLPTATLIPHVHPAGAPGFPPTPWARGCRGPHWGARPGAGWSVRCRRGSGGGGRSSTRRGPGWGYRRWSGCTVGISAALCLVGTFRQLEYPRAWPAGTHVVGPLLWEPPFGEVELPPGDEPLVLVAPSTSQDPGHALLRAALEGLGRPAGAGAGDSEPAPAGRPAGARVRQHPPGGVGVLRAHDAALRAGGLPRRPRDGGAGAGQRCRGGGVPGGGGHERERRAPGLGGRRRASPRRLLTPRTLRWAVRRALEDGSIAERARELAAWACANDGAERAADLVEEFARRDPV